MKTSTITLTFPPFRLDPTNACLWRGAKRLVLPPKDFAVLHHLVTHGGQLVTHEELLKAVWPDAVVSAKGLKAFVRRLRQVLGDRAAQPRFIETVHGQGYRFIGEVVSDQSSVVSREEENQKSKGKNQKAKIPEAQSSTLSPQSWSSLALNPQPPAPALVGRDTDLAQLHRWLDKAANGHRQLVFVTGEPGIGKTALLQAFVAGVQDREKRQKAKGTAQKAKVEDQPLAAHPQPPTPVLISHGQCIEQYGSGEPYLPVLDALGRICRGPVGAALLPVLRRHAPTWLLQMPALLSDSEVEALQRRVPGATRERLLRELAEALEVLTNDHPLIVVLEDLHWADASTLELLAMLARRRESARLLVLGTYRPLEVLGNGHPLNGVMHELHAHELCSELALRLLSEEDVAAYLQERFPHSMFPTRLAKVLHRRTEGNPLFVVSVIDDLVAQGVMVRVDEDWALQGEVERLVTEVPESIRHLVARQRERLPREDQQVLEAASVAGMEFSVAAVAAALEAEVVAVGERCAWLGERQQFLRPAGIVEWPDGTVAARYGFIHALYQQLWHERVRVEQQQQWHLRVGKCKEAAWGPQAQQIATELAIHFEQGRDYSRAIRYLQQAGEKALRRSAYTEAIAHLTKGLVLLPTLPDTPNRTRQELGLRIALATPLTATKGLAAAEVGDTHNRARTLCQQIGETPELFPVLWGLSAFYGSRAEWETARPLAEQLLRLAQRTQDPAFLLQAHSGLGVFMFCRGEFVSARRHLEQGILYGPQQDRSQAFRYGTNPEVFCRSYMALVLWFLGYPEQALQSSREALTLAQELAHPLSLAFTLSISAYLYSNCQEEYLTRERAKEAMTLATEHGFAEVLALATVMWGWSQAGEREEGILRIRQGLTACRDIGVELAQPHRLALLAAAHGRVGQTEEGLKVLAEALARVDSTGERAHETELWRLRGDLLLAQEGEEESQNAKVKAQKSKVPNPQSAFHNPQLEAEECFQKAIKIARQQQAKSFELRAVMSLARLWQQQGKRHEARTTLSDIYNWFTEGFDTVDLQEAKTLLDSLGEGVKL